MGSVNIKGTGSGIILDLTSDVPFEELKEDATQKFRESSAFLGKVSVGLMIRGRKLTDDEERELIQIITENSKLTITCVLKEDPETDELFASFMDKNRDEISNETDSISDQESDSAVTDEIYAHEMVLDTNLARIHRGSLRSGQTLTEQQSVVIMGDVKPGASVTANGSIFVLGALRGTVYAGANGDEKAFVMAMEMDPLQIRIANAIAISPDAEKGPKLKNRRFRKKADAKEPEIAYILNGHVVKDRYGSSFLRVNKI